MIRCPACGGVVDERALSCKYCGHCLNGRASSSFDWSARTKRATYEASANRNQTKRVKYTPKRAAKTSIDCDFLVMIMTILLVGILVLQIIEIFVLLVK